MANANIRFYHYSLTVTYHDRDDESHPNYYDHSYWRKRRITFGPEVNLNDIALDFIHKKCDSAEIAWVYRCLRIQFPQAYREFKQTQQLRLWRRYRPNAPYAKRHLHELRARRHTSQNH